MLLDEFHAFAMNPEWEHKASFHLTSEKIQVVTLSVLEVRCFSRIQECSSRDAKKCSVLIGRL